jgi:hypothetical protein
MVVRHSTGGEVERYIGRHGTRRVAGAVLAAVSPIMLRSVINPKSFQMRRIVDTWFADYISVRQSNSSNQTALEEG